VNIIMLLGLFNRTKKTPNGDVSAWFTRNPKHGRDVRVRAHWVYYVPHSSYCRYCRAS